MKKSLLLLLFITSSIISQTPFDCNDGTFYQVISGALKAYDPITGAYSEALHTYTAYNAGGYNQLDDYMYAIHKSDKHLLRIGKDSITDMGAISPTGNTIFGGGYAADIDADGNLWVFQNGDKQTFHKINNLQTYTGATAPVFEVISADQKAPSTCADIVYINGAFYGGSRGKLYKWDLTSGTPMFSSKTVSNLPTSNFGAAYTDANNRLYVSDNNGGLYLINDYETDIPTATLLNLTEITSSNDGFKCAGGISPLDKDQDGILDSMDNDSDGDGISNTIESNGINPYGDTDGDGMFNYLDSDISGNSDNTVQAAFDRDGDGLPDFLDSDSDSDGIYDITEVGQEHIDTNNDGRFNNSDVGFVDSDFDGLADNFDPDQTGADFIPPDFDNDTIYNCYDIDSDNDGIIDIIEGQDAVIYQGLTYLDDDQDGIDNAFDPDSNGTPSGAIDMDNDGNFDYLDIDADNDGILDCIEAYDTNGDGIAETIASGNDIDADGLDDNYDQLKTVFDSENGGQTPDSFPLQHISDRYQYLGSYTANGTPLYLEENDTVTQETIDLINTALPEGYPVPDFNPQYISSGYDTDLIIEEQTDVWITFVSEESAHQNILGFYTYEINSPSLTVPEPEDITIIFPNISDIDSGGGLETGNKVKIGNFPPDTGIGWVLLTNGWDDQVTSGNSQLYSNPDYNTYIDTSLRQHNVLLSDTENERIILGFEDTRRDDPSSDQDFNDALFYITTDSYTSLKTVNYSATASSTAVSSANDGGLESNGDLANLIAMRNFNRTKTNSIRNQKKTQKRFSPNQISYKSATNEDLSGYFPETGILGTETSFVSSPEDLIDITNATTVFAIDYYKQNNRTAAALATATTGSVYDHSKTICDRLNGSSLLDVRTVQIRNHTLISSKIERANESIEYALTFSVQVNESHNTLRSLWNIDQYPEGNYINFQIWGVSFSQIAHIANHIIDTISLEKPLDSTEMANRIPTVFVKNGYYKQGKLMLNIVNKDEADQITFTGNIRRTEQSEEESITETVYLTPAYHQEITIETGYLFDIGFSITSEHSKRQDALYLADGPWGIDYNDTAVLINTFEIKEDNGTDTGDTHTIERGVLLSGKVKETINVFRNLLAGDLTLDSTDYTSIQFNMENTLPIEIILVTEDLKNWNNRLRITVPAQSNKTMHTLQFKDFVNVDGNQTPITAIRSIVFSVQGNYSNFTSFNLTVSQLKLINSSVLHITNNFNTAVSRVKLFPNPVTNQVWIQLPEYDQKCTLTIIDILGRIVQKETLFITPHNHSITFISKDLQHGLYKYVIRTDSNKEYKSSFIKN